jgi:hypothetical protein
MHENTALLLLPPWQEALAALPGVFKALPVAVALCPP